MRLRKRWGRAERHAGCARRSPAEATEDAGSIPATSTRGLRVLAESARRARFGVSVGGAEPPHTPHGATSSRTSVGSSRQTSVRTDGRLRRSPPREPAWAVLVEPRYARTAAYGAHLL